MALYLFERKTGETTKECPVMSVSPSTREVLARRIAGEIILSARPGATMRKWRELFAVSQLSLSEVMKLSSSVISDYDSGRRKSLEPNLSDDSFWRFCSLMSLKAAGSYVNSLN
jgi:hypothetical protein